MDDMFLLLVCQCAQIYPTLYKPKSTPNLRLKAEIKSSPLILQTATKVTRKGMLLSESDTLLSLKIFGNTNYLTGN